MEGDAEIEGSFLHRWLAGYFFSRVSVFQGFHNNEQVQMRSTIAANISKQFFNNLEIFWHCVVANPGRNRRVGPKIISWASGLNSFLGRY